MRFKDPDTGDKAFEGQGEMRECSNCKQVKIVCCSTQDYCICIDCCIPHTKKFDNLGGEYILTSSR